MAGHRSRSVNCLKAGINLQTLTVKIKHRKSAGARRLHNSESRPIECVNNTDWVLFYNNKKEAEFTPASCETKAVVVRRSRKAPAGSCLTTVYWDLHPDAQKPLVGIGKSSQ